jgi:hypothetical protein
MAQFTLNGKYPTSTTIDQTILFNTERRECKCHVVLADIGAEFFSFGIVIVEDSTKKRRWGR